jgi:hypothetical protein
MEIFGEAAIGTAQNTGRNPINSLCSVESGVLIFTARIVIIRR